MRAILRMLVRSKAGRGAVLGVMKRYDRFAAEVQTFYVRSQLGKVGANFRLGRQALIEHPENVFIGDNVLIHHRAFIYAHSPVVIEDGVYLAMGASLIAPTHDFSKTGKELERNVVSKPIRVCKHAVINSEAMVVGGVTVGEGAIVAAKSLVINDVEPYTYVIGVPARAFYRRKLDE